MHSKSDNIKIMMNDEANEVIKELFKSLQSRYQNNLEKLMNSSEFLLDYVHLLYYKCHKINPNCGRSYIDSPDLMKIKKATTNPINKKDKKLLSVHSKVGLNLEKIGKHSRKRTNIKTFINKYNWEGINFPSVKDDWKKN